MVPRKDVKAALKKLTTPSRKSSSARVRDLQSQLNKNRNISSSPTPSELESQTSSQSSQSSQSSMSTNSQVPNNQLIDVTSKPTVQLPQAVDLSPSKAGKATGKPLSIVYIDIHTVNDENFEGIITKVEAKGIWLAVGQKTSNIKRITIKKGRYAKIGYELTNPIKITEISSKPTFNIEFTRGHVTDVYKIRLPDFDDLAFQIGEIATVSITHTGLETTKQDIEEWVSKFGTVTREARYLNISLTHPVWYIGPVGSYLDIYFLLTEASLKITKSLIKVFYRNPLDRDGIGSDDWVVEVKLNQHIPEQLPIKGNRALVYYPGIPRQCKTCFETGHIASTCPNQKEDYLNYIVRFLNSGHFTELMIGGWIDALKKYHPAYNRSDPSDLRQTIDLNKRGVPKQDLRRKIGPSTDKDLRTNIGRDHQDQPQQVSFQERGRTPKRGNQRGRGRGHPPSRGHHHSNSRGYSRGRGNNNRGNSRGNSRGQRGNYRQSNYQGHTNYE